MPTTPPTAADIDAQADAGFSGGILGSLWDQGISSGTSDGTFTTIVVAYTQNDLTPQLLGIGDPREDFGTVLLLRGLLAAYGNVLLREYVYDYSFTATPWTQAAMTTADFVADSTEQAAINDQANWLAAP